MTHYDARLWAAGRAATWAALSVKTRALSIATLTAGLMLGSVPALAQSGPDMSGMFMKDVLGKLGIIDEDSAPIEYRERAPLVVPPNLNLPKPRATASSHDPNWPKDPDVAAARRAQQEARRPAKVRNDHDGATVLSVDEIRAGRRPGAQVVTTPDPNYCSGDNCRLYLDPEFLKSNGRSAQQEPSLAYGKEPERRTLAEPPKGYRMPSANAPIGNVQAEPIVRENDAEAQRKFIQQQAAQ